MVKKKKGQNLFTRATLRAAMADRPEVMQASGWTYDKENNLVQGDPNEEGARKLADSLSEIASMPIFDLGLGFTGEAIMSIPKIRRAVAALKAARELGKNVKRAELIGKAENGSNNLFRAKVYHGGPVEDPYFAFYTTDPKYAEQYGPVKSYILETKNPAMAKEPLIGSRDVVANDMFVDRNIGGDYSKKAIVGHDMITEDIPYHSNGMEILSWSPNELREIPMPGEMSWDDYLSTYYGLMRTPSPAYSGRVATLESPSARAFVDDVNEAVGWATRRGPYKPEGRGYIDLYPSDYIGDGAEMYVYKNRNNPNEVYKQLHALLDDSFEPGSIPNFESQDEALEFGRKWLKHENNRPYNLRLTLEGVSDNGAGGYSPVFSQPRATIAKNNTIAAPDSKLRELAQRIGDRSSEFSAYGERSFPRNAATTNFVQPENTLRANSIIYENGFNAVNQNPFGRLYVVSKDFSRRNVGVIGPDKKLMGVDLKAEGGILSRLQKHYGSNEKILEAIRKFKEGGQIHIAPSKKGTFTAAAKKHGKSVQAFASQVLAHKENYSPAIVKKANFARNAAKWHAMGGPIGKGYISVEDPDFVGPVLPVEDDIMIDRQRYAESTYNDVAYNKGSKAQGAFQITPVVYDEYTKRTGKKGDLNDPNFNRSVRDWYMNERLPEFQMYRLGAPSDSNRVGRLYASFNAGPGKVLKALRQAEVNGIDINRGFGFLQYLPKETQDYVNFNVRGKDIPGTSKTAAAQKKARANLKGAGGIVERYGSDAVRAALARLKG